VSPVPDSGPDSSSVPEITYLNSQNSPQPASPPRLPNFLSIASPSPDYTPLPAPIHFPDPSLDPSPVPSPIPFRIPSPSPFPTTLPSVNPFADPPVLRFVSGSEWSLSKSNSNLFTNIFKKPDK
jgi:hypothetical protein